MPHALLTLDLSNKIPARNRLDFYRALADLQWKKVQGVSTSFTARFVPDTTAAAMISTTHQDLQKAAKLARWGYWTAVVLPAVTGAEPQKLTSAPARRAAVANLLGH